MIASIRAYFRLRKLSKVLQECLLRQYNNRIDAIHACNKLFRKTGKDYLVVKHQTEDLFCIVLPKSAKILAEKGHIILNPYYEFQHKASHRQPKVKIIQEGIAGQDYSKWIIQ